MEFFIKMEKQLGKLIMVFWLDWGGEYLDIEFKDHLLKHSIISQPTIPGTL